MQGPQPISRKKKFIRDIGIYAIGNLGSKLITFLLVPFYSHYITDTAEYGIYELSLTIIFCFIPILSLQTTDGGFRFLIETDDRHRHRAIISFIHRILLQNCLILILLAAVAGLMHPIKYLNYIIAFGIAQTFYEVTLQCVRGLGRTKLFVFFGISNASLTAILSVLLLAVFNMGIEGIFLANIFAKTATLAILHIRFNFFAQYISFRHIDRSAYRGLLRYSVPLIPVALCWWFVTANNQFFIEHYLGLTDNGYYGLACRFTGILYVITTIFYQTWQQNALEQYNSPDRDNFFTEVFNNYFYLLCFLVATLPFAMRLCYPWLVGKNYQESAQYLYINSIYVMLLALAAFFELGYQCAKKTSRIIPSLLMSIALSVLCNFLLIQRFAVYGVIMSSIITNFGLLVYRIIDTKKYFRISFSFRSVITSAIVAGGFAVYYSKASVLVDTGYLATTTIVFILLLPKQLIRSVLNKMRKR